MDLYKSQTACVVCGVTPRKLDYWVTTGVVAPSHTYWGPNRKRAFFLFSFEDLVRLKTIRELRDAGLPLAKIRTAIELMNESFKGRWKSGWLVTDGANALVRRDSTRLETLTGKHSGQLAFAVVAVASAIEHVQSELAEVVPFDRTQYHGKVEQYRRTGTP